MSRVQGRVILGRDDLGLRIEMQGGGKGYTANYTVAYSPERKWESHYWEGVDPLHCTESRSHAYAAFNACVELLDALKRRGKRIPPADAPCEKCDYRIHFDMVSALNNCNTCRLKLKCAVSPVPGDPVRINCSGWVPREDGEQA